MSRPYQPSLLRLLHGATAVLVTLAWLSGLLVYSAYDGRFGRLPMALPGEWIDIHGTAGVLLWPVALVFGLYAVTLGRARLRRIANAVPLLALALAVGSGKLMQEDWLREGQLQHLVYSAHLTAWLLIAATVVWHITGHLRRGGVALATSIFQLRMRGNDRPRHWPAQLTGWLRRSD